MLPLLIYASIDIGLATACKEIKNITWQGNVSSEDEKPSIRDITIEGIKIFAEPGIRKLPDIIMEKTIKNSTVKNISLKDFSFNGDEVDVSGFCVK